MLSLWVILLATMLGLLVSVEATQVYAAQKTDVSVEVAASCTIASSGHMHIGTLAPATFQNIGEDTSFDVTCNDKEGYVIYAVGISGDKEGTTDMIGSGDNTIATGTAKEGEIANWSFKLSNPSEGMTIQPGFDNYSVIPASKTAVIKRMATTQETGVDHFNATYGVYVATATPADTYEGKVLYTVFHPNSAEVYNYHITFDLNDGEGGPNDSLQVGEVTDNAIKLDPTEPTRNGYNFLGWCDQSSDGTACPDGHLFQPGVELSLPDKNNKFVFYAVWKRYNPIPPECKGLAVGKTGSINDPRDNNSYSIAHLADGNCWMTQNLKLGGDDLTERHLNSSNTDINADDDFTMPVDDPNKSDFPDTSGDGEAHLEYSGNNNYGYYYNWYAATAGTGTKIQDHGDAHGSICPKGWRLPTKSEIDMLITKYDYASAENPPISLPFSGLCYAGNCPQNQGTYGFWWTSTASSATKAYYMYLYNTNAFGANDWWAKGTGFAVRCVAREENDI